MTEQEGGEAMREAEALRSKQLWDCGQTVDRDVRTKMRCQ